MTANSDHRPHLPRALTCAAAPLLVGGVAFCFYLPGIARSPLPGDSSLYVTRSCHLWLNSYAQTHSLYLVAGHLAVKALPWLSPPVALAVLSAAFAAVALGFVYATIRRVTGGNAGAVVGTAALAVSHTFWFHAEFAEVYSLNALFLAAMVYCAVRWREAVSSGRGAGGPRPQPVFAGDVPVSRLATRDPRPMGGGREWLPLCLLAFLGGLGCANHLLAGVSVAVCGAWAAVLSLRHRRPVAHLLAAGAAGLTGLSFLLVLLVRDAQVLGWAKAVQMAFFGGGGIRGDKLILYSSEMGRFFGVAGMRQIALSTGALVYNFAGALAWSAAVWVLCRLRKREALACADGQGAGDLPPTARDPRPATHGEHGENVPPAVPRQAVVALLLCLFGVHFAFGATYTIHEGWAFLLPAWVALACLGGILADRLAGPLALQGHSSGTAHRAQTDAPAGSGGRAASGADPRFIRRIWVLVTCVVAVPVILYAAAPWVVLRLTGRRVADKASPHFMLTPREYLGYYLWPPKSSAGGRAQWLRAALDGLPARATLLLSPANHAMAHYYREIEGRRPDLLVRGVSKSVLSDALGQEHPVFVDRLSEVETLRREGRILRTSQACGLWAVETGAGP